jgi:hypothetical protein
LELIKLLAVQQGKQLVDTPQAHVLLPPGKKQPVIPAALLY